MAVSGSHNLWNRKGSSIHIVLMLLLLYVSSYFIWSRIAISRAASAGFGGYYFV